MFGLPVDVLHTYLGQTATMRVKACSLIPMVNAAGAEMDRAETVTMFNDICVLAPAAPIDAPITWQPIDDRRVRGAFTNGAHSVTADLAFDDNHELVDFTSDDRLRASPDGKTFTPQRWSTPISDYRSFGSRRVGTTGEARRHAPDPDGEFQLSRVHRRRHHLQRWPRRTGCWPGPGTPPAQSWTRRWRCGSRRRGCPGGITHWTRRIRRRRR